MSAPGWIESLARRDRAIVLAGLAGLTALAWIHLVRLSREMTDMAEMGMVHVRAWTAGDAALAAVMWLVMMLGMMLPAAAPMILVFTTVNRRRQVAGGGPYVDTSLFTLGYLVVWTAFSAGAAAAQWGLGAAALLSPEAMTAAPWLGTVLLAAAGVYQLTPLKYACLARCQTPVGFLLTEWREGRAGAFVMGWRHGLFCLGCCWVLMTLLFVGGVMNLTWVAALAVFVLVEKVVPAGRAVSWASGVFLLAWALWTLGAGH
ncbi:MAG: DUF2182 domain-containing protein [Candidatus Rokubacteria bacterium]|nr:DUF2182 domain-containing protein [Candidatus Rokubacteria bacterium]